MEKLPKVEICDSVYSLFDEVHVDANAAGRFYNSLPLDNKPTMETTTMRINGMTLSDDIGLTTGYLVDQAVRIPKKLGLVDVKPDFNPSLMLYLGSAMFQLSEYDFTNEVDPEALNCLINTVVTHELVHLAQSTLLNGNFITNRARMNSLLVSNLATELTHSGKKMLHGAIGFVAGDAASRLDDLYDSEQDEYFDDPYEIEARLYETSDVKILSVVPKHPRDIRVTTENVKIQESYFGLKRKDRKKPEALIQLGRQTKAR